MRMTETGLQLITSQNDGNFDKAVTVQNEKISLPTVFTTTLDVNPQNLERAKSPDFDAQITATM